MCGIVGYTGKNQAAPILLDGLSKLEYRGYDSAGVAVRTPDGNHEVVKAKGKLSTLSDMIDGGAALSGTCGIGHTRWATHGEPNEINAHPHYNDDKSIVAVHNGIIENYAKLKDKLLGKGYSFYSKTDTEIATKLIDYYYNKWDKDPLKAMVSFTLRVRGSYAFAVMFRDHPGKIFVARKDSPLIVGVSNDGAFCASDVPAILKFTRDVYYLDNMQIACLESGKATFYDVDSSVVKKKRIKIDWDMDAAEKGGYEFFMMKEIKEQPEVIKSTLACFVKDDVIDFSEAKLSDSFLKSVGRIHFVACGSAYHAGVVGKYVIEGLARVPVNVDIASEFRYRNPILNKNDLVIFISQSGETADTFEALNQAKAEGVATLAIVNVHDSAIPRVSDKVIYTQAGPEISVATTKAYSAQLVVCYMLAVKLAYVRGTIDEERYKELIAELKALPSKVISVLKCEDDIKKFANGMTNKHDVFFIGRGIDYAVCLEGSLKLKEITYIHSEAYAAGELKHGTISLIEDDTLVVALLTQPELADKTKSNLEEVKTRGAYCMCVAVKGNYGIRKDCGFTVYVPHTESYFMPSLSVIPLQLLSYYVSLYKGLDVDKPRNLAKCVTVE